MKKVYLFLIIVNICFAQGVGYTNWADNTQSLSVTIPAGKYYIGIQYSQFIQPFRQGYIKLNKQLPIYDFKRSKNHGLNMIFIGEKTKSIFNNLSSRGILLLGLNYIQSRSYLNYPLNLYSSQTYWQLEFAAGIKLIFFKFITLGIMASIHHNIGISFGVNF